jgi:hypothetical protein
MAEEKEKLGWKMNKNGMLLISILFLSLAVVIKPVAGGATVVKVDPSLIEYHEDATGQQFTVAIKIVDVTNLYGFDIILKWNTTFLDYVSHSVHVPKDNYTDGVLWNPIIPPWEDQVNATTGTYWVACASRYPAPSFNGTGTVFNMTFAVVHHPVQPEPNANITLQLYSTELSNNVGAPIPHTRQNGTVILYALSPRHDVSVTNVTSSKTVVGQGYSLKINFTAANQGDYTETFNVTAYANTTSVASQNVTLSSGNSTTIIFTWNTTGFVKGNYTIKAVADTVSGETETGDNALTDGVVYVGVPGDVDGNHKVEIKDILLLAKAYGTNPQSLNWNPNLDVNGDDKVDIKDILIAAKNYGKTDP